MAPGCKFPADARGSVAVICKVQSVLLASPINRTTAVLALLATALAGQLAVGPIRQGWSQMFTDFPNHYTAAVLTLHHEPLRRFYDWEWFQRQIHYAGIERQLGGYAPYTPLTMLPFLPLAELKPQRAKQVWLLAELAFLAAAVWLLARLTQLGFLKTLVLALLAHAALSANFRLGHYYIFLMLLLACAAWCLLKGRDATGGALLGLILALKLYAAPFIFYFAVKRQWRAFWGMTGMVALLTLAATAMFGWSDVWFFVTTIMLRGIEGEVVDPYSPGVGSLTVLLRRMFVPEAGLNPHPLLDAPAAFFFSARCTCWASWRSPCLPCRSREPRAVIRTPAPSHGSSSCLSRYRPSLRPITLSFFWFRSRCCCAKNPWLGQPA